MAVPFEKSSSIQPFVPGRESYQGPNLTVDSFYSGVTRASEDMLEVALLLVKTTK